MPKIYKRVARPGSAIMLLFVLVVVSACGNAADHDSGQQNAMLSTSEPPPSLAPNRVVLVAPPEEDHLQIADAETLLRELAAASNLDFEIRQEVFANELTEDVKVLVFLRQPENLGSLAAGAPNTYFIALTDQEWNPAENVTVIRKREDQTAFMAGYLAAMLAPNFRAGALLAAENEQFNQAFQNGVQYFCGICAALINPLNSYPVVSVQPANSPPANWQAAYNEANTSQVNVLLVDSEAYSAELFNNLSSMDVALIGTQIPPEEAMGKWVATISSDGVSPIREIWDDVIAGRGGNTLNADIKITNYQFVNVTEGLVWLSEGRLNLALKVIDMLREELIYPLSVTQ